MDSAGNRAEPSQMSLLGQLRKSSPRAQHVRFTPFKADISSRWVEVHERPTPNVAASR